MGQISCLESEVKQKTTIYRSGAESLQNLSGPSLVFLLSHINSSEEDLFFCNQKFSFSSKIALTSAAVLLRMHMLHNRALTCCEVRGSDPELEQQKYKEK